METFYSTEDCKIYLEKKYKIKFNMPYIGQKTNKNLFNKGWVIGETTNDGKKKYRIDFDEKIGFHINYEGGKGEVYEHCLIRTNAFIEDKYEYWIALNKNYQIPYPIFQK